MAISSIGLVILLLWAAPERNDFRYQVGFSQDWYGRQVADRPRSTGTQRGLRLGLWHHLGSAAFSSLGDIYWHKGKAQLASGRLALDSLRLRQVNLDGSIGDNSIALSDPADEFPLAYRGVAFRLGLKDITIQAVGGKAQDRHAQTPRTFTWNRYLFGLESKYKAGGLHISPYLVHRADNPDNSLAASNTVLGTGGELSAGDNLLLSTKLSLCTYKERTVPHAAYATRTGVSYIGRPISARLDLKYIKAGYLSPANNFNEHGRREIIAMTRYQASLFTVTGGGSRYWNEKGKDAGTRAGAEASIRIPRLPVLTVEGGFREEVDSLRINRELSAKARMRKTFSRWWFTASEQHFYYLAERCHGNIAELGLGYVPQHWLNIELGAGIGHGRDSIEEFARMQVSYRPFDWTELSGNIGTWKRVMPGGQKSTGRSAGIGIALSPFPMLGVSGNLGLEDTRILPGQDSLTSFVGFQLTSRPLPWMCLSGNLKTGRIERAHSPASVLNMGLNAGISFAQGLQAVVGLSREKRTDVTDDRLGISFHKQGGLKRFGFASISGHVFQDKNGNKVFDKGDTPAPGVRVMLNERQEVLTDSKGGFRFPMLEKGRYRIECDPTGLPAYLGSFLYTRQVAVGFIGTKTADFPVYELGQVTGRVFLDENRNGKRDDEERGFPNVVVFMDSPERMTLTKFKGYYRLANLEPGGYEVKVRNLPPSFEFTTPELCKVDIAPGGTATVDFGFAPKLRPVRKKVFE